MKKPAPAKKSAAAARAAKNPKPPELITKSQDKGSSARPAKPKPRRRLRSRPRGWTVPSKREREEAIDELLAYDGHVGVSSEELAGLSGQSTHHSGMVDDRSGDNGLLDGLDPEWA